METKGSFHFEIIENVLVKDTAMFWICMRRSREGLQYMYTVKVDCIQPSNSTWLQDYGYYSNETLTNAVLMLDQRLRRWLNI